MIRSASLLTVLALAASTPPADDDLATRLAAVAAEEVEAQDEIGLALAVDVGGELLLAEGWGYADVGAGVPASVESSFRVGALTETLLAVAALRLVEAGELDLDDPVKNHLPALDLGDDVVLVRHLLAHTSGLPRLEDVLAVPGAADAEPGSDAFFAALASLALESTPGECFRYSDADTLVLGAVVAGLVEGSVREHLERSLLAGLEDLRYCEDGPPIEELAEEGHYVGGEFHEHFEHAAPPHDARLLCATVLDVLAFQRALVERELLDDAGWNLLTTEQRLADGTPTDYGLGVNLAPLADAECVSYGGAVAGARAFVAYYPAIDLTVVVLARGEDVEVDRIQRRVARAVLELPDPELRDASLTRAERAVYLGGYYSGCTRIEVRETGEHLALLLPDGEEHALVPQGEHEFVAGDDPEVVVSFEVGDEVTGLWLVRRGAAIYAKRLD